MDAATREYLRSEIDRKTRAGVAAKNRAARGKTHRTPPTAPLKIAEVMFPTEILAAALTKHAKENGWGDTPNMIHAEIARRTGYDEKRLSAIWEQANVSFDVADYIVTRVHVHLWFKDEGLNRVYESMDFRWYDSAWRQHHKREQMLAYQARYRGEAAKKAKLRGARLHEERMARMKGTAVQSTAPDGRAGNGASAERMAEIRPRRRK